ncbi:MAG: DUF1146 domain-containing protein [Bacilli bacterium]|jgi:hypothetical protein|nr:DUF1146 domain-containing protein [Bacilli bacterium]
MDFNVVLNALYIIIFLASMIVILKLLLESQLHTIFKQGRILEIRIFYCLISVIGGYLTASAFVRLVEAIVTIIN